MKKRVFSMVMVVLFLAGGIAFAETADKTASAEQDTTAVEMTTSMEPEGYSEEAKVNPATEEIEKAVLPEKSDAAPQDIPADTPASK
jgi:hypothetical protein